MVTSITVRFNSLVTFAGSSVGAFQLTRTGPGGPTGAVTIAVDLSGSTATRTVAHLTFGGALAASGSLTDGTYALTVLSSQVSAGGRALDGDGDGVAGGDSVASLFRFFGDITGDRFVNGADFALFRAAFGTSTGDSNYNAAFDVNGDGFVNGADFAVFRTNFGGSI
jgi:hypothetical protein